MSSTYKAITDLEVAGMYMQNKTYVMELGIVSQKKTNYPLRSSSVKECPIIVFVFQPMCSNTNEKCSKWKVKVITT